MWLEITPFDALFFRDGKPFAAGDQTVANHQFPPFVLPFVGAVRTRMLLSLLDELNLDLKTYAKAVRNDSGGDKVRTVIEQIGDNRGLGRLTFAGPFLCRREQRKFETQAAEAGAQVEVMLPPPRDVLKGSKDHNGNAEHSRLLPTAYFPWKPLRTSSRLWWLMPDPPAAGLQAPEKDFFLGSFLNDYLLDRWQWIRDQPLFVEGHGEVMQAEPRTGIALGDQRTVRIGLLYTASMIRLDRGLSFLLKVDHDSPSVLQILQETAGVLKLGGEGKLACYRVVDEAVLPELLRTHQSGFRRSLEDAFGYQRQKCGKLYFKLYLMAPSIFTKGWRPDSVTEDGTWQIDGAGIKANLVAAAVGKPGHVSGWDLARRQPRDLLRVVPAGSVYFFSVEERVEPQAIGALVEHLHGRSLMGPSAGDELQGDFYRAAGFGLAALGIWWPKEEHL